MSNAVDELEKNTKILGQAEVGDAYRQQFEDLAKSMGKTTTELRTLLELILAMEHAVKGQEAISKFLTGSAGEDLGRRIALQKTSIAIQKLDNAIQAEAEGEKKKQLQTLKLQKKTLTSPLPKSTGRDFETSKTNQPSTKNVNVAIMKPGKKAHISGSAKLSFGECQGF